MEAGVQARRKRRCRWPKARAAIRAGCSCRCCAIWVRRAFCLRLSDPAQTRLGCAGRSGRHVGRFHRSACLVRGLSAGRRLDRSRSDIRPADRRSHVPLAATPHFRNAAPITGMASFANVEFDFDMHVDRIAEHPRITEAVLGLVLERSTAGKRSAGSRKVRTSASQWAASQPSCRSMTLDGRMEHRCRWPDQARESRHSDRKRLRDRFAPGGFLHYGQEQMVPGQDPAALDVLALLARRRRAGLARPEPDRGGARGVNQAEGCRKC